jgi:hypothetical protein
MKGRSDTTPAKADTGHFENPADADAIKAVEAARAAGTDPFGDMDEDEPAAAASPEPSEQTEGETGLDTDDLDALDDDGSAATDAAPPEQQTAAETPAEPAEQPTAQPVVQYKTRSAKELAESQAATLTERTEAFKAFSDGTMTAEEYAEIDAKAMTTLMAIASERALQEAGAQTALQESEAALASIKALAVKQGHVDYDKDSKAATQFDQASAILGADPEMAKLPDAEFFGKVHSMVLFMRGITAPAIGPGATPAAKPAARQDMRGPTTLRGIPAAATPNTGGGLSEQLGRLNGLDFEDAVGSLSRSQRDQWLDS